MKKSLFIVIPLYVVMSITYSPAAAANIIVHGNQSFQDQVNDALDKLIEASAETAQIVNGLKNSMRQTIINHNTAGTLLTIPHNEPNGTSQAAGGNGTGSSSTVQWDPSITDPRREGINDPCVTLIHELRHAFDLDRGVGDMRDNDGNMIPDEQERAIRTENAYRRSVGHPQRLTDDGHPVPAWAHF